jgi:hypothetical protein
MDPKGVTPPLRVYIAGPLTAPTYRGVLDNIERADRAGAEVIRAGHYPFIPHHSWNTDEEYKALTGEGKPHAWWMQWCLTWIDFCDVVYRIGASPGADMERDYALAAGIPVVTDLRHLSEVKR